MERVTTVEELVGNLLVTTVRIKDSARRGTDIILPSPINFAQILVTVALDLIVPAHCGVQQLRGFDPGFGGGRRNLGSILVAWISCSGWSCLFSYEFGTWIAECLCL
ncbi:unnamed protein product [Urochloa humidicola]